jgi:hypothetical protein
VRKNSSFASPIPLALLLDGSDGRIARELWWMSQEFSPIDAIPPWLSMFISVLISPG